MNIYIEKNLRLELLNESHTEELFRLTDLNRNYLREWLPWVDGTKTAKDTAMFVKNSITNMRRKNSFQCAIKYKNKIIGMIGLVYINRHFNLTEIGYWLAEKCQGKGIMTKACRTMIDYCFNELNLIRVTIRCERKNKSSQRIPERLNFFRQGILKRDGLLNGKLVDHVQYSMRKKEWDGLKKKKIDLKKRT